MFTTHLPGAKEELGSLFDVNPTLIMQSLHPGPTLAVTPWWPQHFCLPLFLCFLDQVRKSEKYFLVMRYLWSHCLREKMVKAEAAIVQRYEIPLTTAVCLLLQVMQTKDSHQRASPTMAIASCIDLKDPMECVCLGAGGYIKKHCKENHTRQKKSRRQKQEPKTRAMNWKQ